MIRLLAGLILLTPFLSARADILDLKWMAGCWSQDDRETGSVELWTVPAGGTMLGMNRIVSGGKTVAFEFLRIIEEEDGQIWLVASPSGQETARFKLASISADEVIFENPHHDFPQRIIYRLENDGNLAGRIEGTDNGTAKAADFPMTRARCGNEDEPE